MFVCFELYAFELSVNYKCLNVFAFEPVAFELYAVSLLSLDVHLGC